MDLTRPVNLDGSALIAGSGMSGGARLASSVSSAGDTNRQIGLELPEFTDGPSLYTYARSAPTMYVDPTGQAIPFLVGLGVVAAYALTPSVANAPGPNDEVIPSDDLTPFVNAGAVATCSAPRALVYRPLFAPGALANSNRYLRIGEGRHAGGKYFRAAGDWVEKTTGRKHIDFWRIGRW